MKPFLNIAIPYDDVIEGKFTKDSFAAKLWSVYKGTAPEEYADRDIFFRRTYLSPGIELLIEKVEKRLKGKGGDPVIQLETLFGGGKTHSLIALYHKAKEIGAKVIAFDGSEIGPKDIMLWEEIERQLEGKVSEFKGYVPPSAEKLRSLFKKHEPVLILIDEIADYTISASGIKFEDTLLSDFVLNFMRILPSSIPEKSALVITYPSRIHYDEKGQKILNLLMERTGRESEPFLPIRDEDIYDVVRRRLFKFIDENALKDIVNQYMDYADKEDLLKDLDKSLYRKKFMKSYPFKPEVIDVLYKKWGSYHRFQRTRGVLYLLASVIHNLKDKKIPFIRLSDFDLNDNRIRSVLTDIIGAEWNSIIAQDITDQDAGAKKVDREFPSSYLPYKLGTAVSTAIFMSSFSAGPERGATKEEIRIATSIPGIPSSIIVEALDKLTEPLNSLYLDIRDKRYLYVTEVPLTKALLTKMENITLDDIKEEEERLLKEKISRKIMDIYIWEENSNNISDNQRLKLIIMNEKNKSKCKKIIEEFGERPRVYRNTLIFLCPDKNERENLEKFLREKLAFEALDKDTTLHLGDKQREEIKRKIKQLENEVYYHLRKFYRFIFVPSKEGVKEIDLGIPTYGTEKSIDREVYQKLKEEEEIIEKLTPIKLKQKYLNKMEFVETKKIYESFLKTPGEIRIVSEDVLKNCIKEGVEEGLFGLGYLEEDKAKCKHYKESVLPEFSDEEIILKSEFCEEEKVPDKTAESIEKVSSQPQIGGAIKEPPGITEISKRYKTITLKLKNVGFGKMSCITKLLNYLTSKFKRCEVKIEISAQEGEISEAEYENQILETLKQLGIEFEEDKK